MASLTTLIYQIAQWYDLPLGRAIAAAEQAQYAKFLSERFGYHLLYMGLDQHINLSCSPIPHHIVLNPVLHSMLTATDVYGEYDALPFRENSLDIVLASHVLEYSENPQAVLKQIWHALIPQGYLILFCFNRYSLFGLWGNLKGRYHGVPWSSKFCGLGQLSQWVNNEEFEIINQQTLFFKPPFFYNALLDRFEFMEKIGSKCYPLNGSVNMIIAQKKVVGAKVIKPAWQDQVSVVLEDALESNPQSYNR